MKLSIKHYPIGKPAVTDGKSLTYRWQSVNLTPAEIVQHICAGKPIAVGQYKDGHRKKANFIVSELIALDYDENYSDDVYTGLIASPFIQKYAFAVIQTASSKENSRRCRVLFRLDTPVYDAGVYGDLVRFMLEIAPYGPDHAAVDPARAFYGSRPSTIADFYNPYSLVVTAPILADIQQQKERERIARENRPQSEELPDDYLKAIEQALGVTSYNNEGWSNRIACPIGQHEHDDTNPAAAWNKEFHILKCLKCHSTGEKYLAWEVAKALGIERRREGKKGDRGDLSQAPENHIDREVKKGVERRGRYDDLICLPDALRKALICDKLVNMQRILDALLNERIPRNCALTMADIVDIMQDYSLGKSGVYSAMTIFSEKINALLYGEWTCSNSRNNSRGRPVAYYCLEKMLWVLEKHYACPIHGTGDLLHNHAETLHSAKECKQYSVLKYFSDRVEITASQRTIAMEFNVSAGTISKYTRELRDQGLLEITPHYKRHTMSEDEIGNLSTTLENWRNSYSNCYVEMYISRDGVRYECVHKGGKSGIPSNRIPAIYGAVMHFFDENVKANKRKTGREFSNIVFVLVSKQANSYRRVERMERVA